LCLLLMIACAVSQLLSLAEQPPNLFGARASSRYELKVFTLTVESSLKVQTLT
jgi:hypothetical protein